MPDLLAEVACGGVSTAAVSAALNPVDVIKTRRQLERFSERRALDIAQSLWAEGGAATLWRPGKHRAILSTHTLHTHAPRVVRMVCTHHSEDSHTKHGGAAQALTLTVALAGLAATIAREPYPNPNLSLTLTLTCALP